VGDIERVLASAVIAYRSAHDGAGWAAGAAAADLASLRTHREVDQAAG
jgi:hypothetical protein